MFSGLHQQSLTIQLSKDITVTVIVHQAISLYYFCQLYITKKTVSLLAYLRKIGALKRKVGQIKGKIGGK